MDSKKLNPENVTQVTVTDWHNLKLADCEREADNICGIFTIHERDIVNIDFLITFANKLKFNKGSQMIVEATCHVGERQTRCKVYAEIRAAYQREATGQWVYAFGMTQLVSVADL